MNGTGPDLERTRAEKMAAAVLPVSGLAWAAAEGMYLAGVHAALPLGGATALASALAWGTAGRRDDFPQSLPWWIAVEGAWLTAADALGPLCWWPAPVLTIAWAGIALAARRAAHRHDAVTSAREWREARADWLGRSHDWGLGGSHLLSFQRTRLGELYVISTKGTGKLASSFVRNRGLEEWIAQQEDLPPGRVQVTGHALAGRIRVSVRRNDPWADPILHPLACEDHEITLPERRSILDVAVIGQDPETGEPLMVPLCDEDGAKRVSVTANSGGGKGVLEDNLFEHVTDCRDAVAVHLNLSVKGYEDEESWGPACWLTAYGPEQKSRAAAVLKVIGEVLEWRTKNFRRGQYVPSPEHPAIIVFADESDAATAAVRDGLNMIATKGRSHGVGYVHLGQRNTRDYADPKARSQDNVRCTGLVQNSNEARHAGSGAGPDMSTYGEGKPGVWKVELLGGGMSMGRTWIFHPTPAGHGAAAERIARERAFDQPELTGACREYLGGAYEALLATEVFTRWAHAQGPEGEPEEGGAPADGTPPPDDGETRDAAAAPAVSPARTALAEQDPLERLWEMDMDEGTEAARRAAIRGKLGAAGQVLREATARPAPPQVPGEALAARTAARWRQVAEEPPRDLLGPLLEMLGEGTTISAVAKRFGVEKWQARKWLEYLRLTGATYVDGERSAARWRLAPPLPGGDAP